MKNGRHEQIHDTKSARRRHVRIRRAGAKHRHRRKSGYQKVNETPYVHCTQGVPHTTAHRRRTDVARAAGPRACVHEIIRYVL